MKRLLVVTGGLAAIVLATAALSHSPPGNEPAVSSAPVVKVAPNFEPVAQIDLKVANVSALAPIVVLASSLRNEQVALSRGWRPTQRHPSAKLTLPNAYTQRHVSNTAMRGWGFL